MPLIIIPAVKADLFVCLFVWTVGLTIYVALASQELLCVDQAGPELTEISLPQPRVRARIKSVHHMPSPHS